VGDFGFRVLTSAPCNRLLLCIAMAIARQLRVKSEYSSSLKSLMNSGNKHFRGAVDEDPTETYLAFKGENSSNPGWPNGLFSRFDVKHIREI
jgi:hypothetical protein